MTRLSIQRNQKAIVPVLNEEGMFLITDCKPLFLNLTTTTTDSAFDFVLWFYNCNTDVFIGTLLGQGAFSTIKSVDQVTVQSIISSVILMISLLYL